jgi:hypothetical protein
MSTPDLPREAARLLAVSPGLFVSERASLARELRDDGRPDEARAVKSMRKPSPVVLAVNRAARDRPQAAKDAAAAAERLGRVQLGGKPDEYRTLVRDMEAASDLLSEVAVAHLPKATEAMRRRVADHVRGALSGKDTRKLLARGALTEEVESRGFDAYAGLPTPKKRPSTSPEEKRDAARARRAREAELRKDISAVRAELRDAERRVRDANKERDALTRRIEELEEKLGSIEG